MWVAAALFLHVLAVVALFAAVALILVCEARMRTARDLSQLADWANLASIAGKSLAGISLVILLPALYLVPQGWSFTTPWVLAALIAFVALAVLGATITGPKVAAIEQSAAAAAGPIPAALRQRTHDRLLLHAEWTRIALLIWMLFLMTNKPGVVELLVACALALFAGGITSAWFGRTPSSAAIQPS